MFAVRWPVAAATIFVAVALLVVGGSPAAAYTVRQGDTLWNISRQTGVSVPDLIRINGLHDPNRIYPGQELKLAAAAAPSAGSYRVQSGDTLTSISRKTGVSVATLAALNHLQRPYLLHSGQVLMLSAPAPAAAVGGPAPAGVPDVQTARALLSQAARKHGLRPSFVQALSYWESGWNQRMVSNTGAVGLMQLEPGTAAYAGPWLLNRSVNINDPRDNVDLGSALLRHYIDEFNDPKLALAAYFQGEAGTQKYGVYPSSQNYVDGIWALRNRIEAGQL
jgi:N-acetylmuramoyl-L-alanine amidase